MIVRFDPPLLIGDFEYLEAVGDDLEEPTCASLSSGETMWCCTRSKGHTGLHAAHGNNDQQYASWDANDSQTDRV